MSKMKMINWCIISFRVYHLFPVIEVELKSCSALFWYTPCFCCHTYFSFIPYAGLFICALTSMLLLCLCVCYKALCNFNSIKYCDVIHPLHYIVDANIQCFVSSFSADFTPCQSKSITQFKEIWSKIGLKKKKILMIRNADAEYLI